jgi:hypothetical protein
VDLSTFIVSVFCLNRRPSQGPRSSPRARTYPHAVRLGGPHHRGRRRVFGNRRRHRALCILPAPLHPLLPKPQIVCIAPPSAGRLQTSGRPRSASGKSSWPRPPTIPPSPWRTLCPCRCAPSPELTAAGASKGRRPSARTPSSSRPSTAFGCM